MKYLLLVYRDEELMDEMEREDCHATSARLLEDLQAKGKVLHANPLASVRQAQSLRVRDGKSLITDGPFAETREQLGGYFLVDVSNIEEAFAIAEQLPPAKKGTIEIRPVIER